MRSAGGQGGDASQEGMLEDGSEVTTTVAELGLARVENGAEGAPPHPHPRAT